MDYFRVELDRVVAKALRLKAQRLPDDFPEDESEPSANAAGPSQKGRRIPLSKIATTEVLEGAVRSRLPSHLIGGGTSVAGAEARFFR